MPQRFSFLRLRFGCTGHADEKANQDQEGERSKRHYPEDQRTLRQPSEKTADESPNAAARISAQEYLSCGPDEPGKQQQSKGERRNGHQQFATETRLVAPAFLEPRKKIRQEPFLVMGRA